MKKDLVFNKCYIHLLIKGYEEEVTLSGLTELEMYKALYLEDFEEVDKYNVLEAYKGCKLEVICYGSY